MVPKKSADGSAPETEKEKVIVYPNRTRIQQRLEIVYKALLACENPDEVVVISHSQGTLIALETLRDGRLAGQVGDAYIKPTLVTMGLPTWHIYNYYFSSDFPIDGNIKKDVAKWINIFRFDDFVGTNVAALAGDSKSETDWPLNIPVPPRGHTGYWVDDDVRPHLVNHALSEFSGVAAGTTLS